MSDEPFDLDFNNAGPQFLKLGDRAAKSLQAAMDLLARNPDAPASAASAIYAARLSLLALARLSNCNKETAGAIVAICGSLKKSEKPLRMDAAKPRRGRPGASAEAIKREARAVAAVEWLQKLRINPLSAIEANAAVAGVVGKKNLEAIKEAFANRSPTAFLQDTHRERQRILNELKFEILESPPESWREIIGSEPCVDRQTSEIWGDDPETVPVYSEILSERDHLDLTQKQVLDWLRSALQ